MGTGISHVLALAGYDVVLDDINKDALSKAIERVEKNMQRQAAKGVITDRRQIPPALARIRVTQTMDDLKDRDLVIEAATEDEAIKKKIFQDLCKRICDKAHDRHQHLIHFGDAPGLRHRPPREFHRPALHESGAADAAGGSDPRHRHQ